MAAVRIEPAVMETLAGKLEALSGQLTDDEHRALLDLLALGSSAVRRGAERSEETEVQPFMMGGFAQVMSVAPQPTPTPPVVPNPPGGGIPGGTRTPPPPPPKTPTT